jgi:hypothetical protein
MFSQPFCPLKVLEILKRPGRGETRALTPFPRLCESPAEFLCYAAIKTQKRGDR